MINVAGLMESGIDAEAMRVVIAVGRAAEERGAEPYLVGGLPRDLIVGAHSSRSPDLDITLVGAGSDTFDYIARRVSGQITRRSQFNTVSMRVGGRDFDLIMARSESYPSPGSLPVVRQGTLDEDLARRDFSVNAMAVSLSERTWGALYDPRHGRDDLRLGTLRTLYPDSFRDDATRILRAARYASRLSLRLTPETRSALGESVGYIRYISPARAGAELERVFLEPNAAAALGLLEEWGALASIHPALGHDAGAWTLFSERVVALSERDRVAVGYATLGAKMSGSDAAGVIARLMPNSLARRAIREAAELANWISGGGVVGLSNSGLSDRLDRLSEHSVAGCAISAADSSVGKRLDEYLGCLRAARPELTGDDIIALGVTQGPEVGRIRRLLRAARQDGIIESREGEEAFVIDRLKASDEF